MKRFFYPLALAGLLAPPLLLSVLVGAAAAVYLAITSVSLLVLRYLERRYSVGVKAAEL